MNQFITALGPGANLDRRSIHPQGFCQESDTGGVCRTGNRRRGETQAKLVTMYAFQVFATRPWLHAKAE
jgi:hypothetical protein